VTAAPQFVEVSIAGRTLKLSPLDLGQTRTAATVATRLTLAAGKPLSRAWFDDMNAALRLVCSAAQTNHPTLTFDELYHACFPEEIINAFDALAEFMLGLCATQRSN
jgi:hypothetical protein